jgi:uncharacterized Tic20 family protein
MWAAFCHLGGLVGSLIPVGNIIIPLVIWLVYRDRYPLVEDQGREALNFQISMMIYLLASAVLVFVVIGILLLIALGILELIVVIIAAINAADGKRFRYPLTIRFVQ